jgi:hypothetical protein
MGSETKDFTLGEVEETLRQIEDIEAARVVVGSSQDIEEIHILASPSKGPKQLVRDIESTLMARFGIPVNHKKISIAQIGRNEIGKDKPRPKILSINTEISGVHSKTSVILTLNGTQFEGAAKGPASKTGLLRLVALATLDAIEKLTPPSYGFALEDVAIVSLGRERVAIACIAMVAPFGEQTFAGSALVRQNEKSSVVRAVLNAINRRFGSLTTI